MVTRTLGHVGPDDHQWRPPVGSIVRVPSDGYGLKVHVLRRCIRHYLITDDEPSTNQPANQSIVNTNTSQWLGMSYRKNWWNSPTTILLTSPRPYRNLSS
jgi:hypothetical protein